MRAQETSPGGPGGRPDRIAGDRRPSHGTSSAAASFRCRRTRDMGQRGATGGSPSEPAPLCLALAIPADPVEALGDGDAAERLMEAVEGSDRRQTSRKGRLRRLPLHLPAAHPRLRAGRSRTAEASTVNSGQPEGFRILHQSSSRPNRNQINPNVHWGPQALSGGPAGAKPPRFGRAGAGRGPLLWPCGDRPRA